MDAAAGLYEIYEKDCHDFISRTGVSIGRLCKKRVRDNSLHEVGKIGDSRVSVRRGRHSVALRMDRRTFNYSIKPHQLMEYPAYPPFFGLPSLLILRARLDIILPVLALTPHLFCNCK